MIFFRSTKGSLMDFSLCFHVFFLRSILLHSSNVFCFCYPKCTGSKNIWCDLKRKFTFLSPHKSSINVYGTLYSLMPKTYALENGREALEHAKAILLSFPMSKQLVLNYTYPHCVEEYI